MKKLPPLQDVLKSIQTLRTEKWPSFENFNSVDEFTNFFQEKFVKHFNQQMIYLSKPMVNPPWKLYRVRPYDELKDPTIIREHSYPPVTLCKKNRANLPGHPVFYSSPNPSIAMLETLRNNTIDTDKRYCLSLWQVKERDKPFIVSPFIYHVDDEDFQEVSKNILTTKIKEALAGSPYADDWESFSAIVQYLSASFHEDDEKNYSISSFIGHSHLYMPFHAKTDFLIYPSVQSERKAVNIAVNPETADNYVVLKYLLILNVTELDIIQNHIRFSVSEYGIVKGDKIEIKPVGNETSGPDPIYLDILKEFTATL